MLRRKIKLVQLKCCIAELSVRRKGSQRDWHTSTCITWHNTFSERPYFCHHVSRWQLDTDYTKLNHLYLHRCRSVIKFNRTAEEEMYTPLLYLLPLPFPSPLPSSASPLNSSHFVPAPLFPFALIFLVRFFSSPQIQPGVSEGIVKCNLCWNRRQLPIASSCVPDDRTYSVNLLSRESR